MDTPPPTLPAAVPFNALGRRGRLDVKNPPPGRFLYTLNGAGAIFEGRLLESCEDPEHEGTWVRLDAGDVWQWSKEIWIEVEFPPSGPQEKIPLLAEMPASDFEALLTRTAQIIASAILPPAEATAAKPAPVEPANARFLGKRTK